LIAAAVTVAIASFWWIAIIQLLPAGSRPYIGGSTTNAPLDLLLGYDGLGRLFGELPPGSGPGSALGGPPGPTGDGPAGLTFAGRAGPLRLFNDQFAGQVAWLIPAAVLALGVGIALHARRERTDRRVAGYLLWGSWLTVHALVFSLMSGTIHAYYAVILAPALAALVGGSATELWQRRATSRRAGATMAVGVLAIGLTAWSILGRTPDFVPGVGIGVLAVSAVAAVVLAIPARLTTPWAARGAIVLAIVAALAAPLAYDADTMATAYRGGDPIAGPAARFAVGPPGLGGPGDPVAGRSFVDYLVANAGSARWIVAVTGTQVAADIQLASGLPVMTMGGFLGSDPVPTLDELKAAIQAGELRFVLLRYLTVDAPGGVISLEFHGGPGGAGGPGVSGERTTWVAENCAAVSLDGSTSTGLYDCANP
jgi:4-amino-4-deoxy-L-arabinose transferase-like glycosyltransferase